MNLLEGGEVGVGSVASLVNNNKLSYFFKGNSIEGQSMGDFIDGQLVGNIFARDRYLITLQVPGRNYLTSPHIPNETYLPLSITLTGSGSNGQQVRYNPIFKMGIPRDQQLLLIFAGERHFEGAPERTWHDAFNFRENEITGYAEALVSSENVTAIGLPLGICGGAPWREDNAWTAAYSTGPTRFTAAYDELSQSPKGSVKKVA